MANIYMFIVPITDVWYIIWVLRKKISKLTEILRAHENVVFGNVCLTKKLLLQYVRDSKFWNQVANIYMFIVPITDVWYMIRVLRKKISNLTEILRAHENVVFGNVCLTKKLLLQYVRDSKFWNQVANIYMFIVPITDVWYIIWVLRKKISNLTEILRAHENVVFGNVCLTKKLLLQYVRDSKFWNQVANIYMFIVLITVAS